MPCQFSPKCGGRLDTEKQIVRMPYKCRTKTGFTLPYVKEVRKEG